MADDAPVLRDFARGYQLQTDGRHAIYQLSLPGEVYRTVVRRDLGDIRVFNKFGERVPHAIRRPPAKQVQESISITLPFFPLQGARQVSKIDKDFMITDDGTLIRIRTTGQVLTAENAEIGGYIIDVSHLKKTIDELEFEITGTAGSYIKQASLQYSHDLNQWLAMTDNLTLAELDYGNYSLKKTAVKLPNRRVKYLRFLWLGRSDGLQINKVSAILDSVTATQERQWLEITGSESKDEPGLFTFDTGGLFAAERINVVLPEENTLIEAGIYSRSDEKQDWRRRYSGLFYKLHVNDNYLEQGDISIPPAADRYWQLRVKTKDGLGSQPPRIRFGWTPNDLYFLARGKGPFTLAFGNGRAQAPGKPIDTLMKVLRDDQEDNLIGRATLGEAIVLMGREALKHERKIPWQRILLWVVLVIGVIVIAYMAVRLFGQMNTEPEEEG